MHFNTALVHLKQNIFSVDQLLPDIYFHTRNLLNLHVHSEYVPANITFDRDYKTF